MIVRIQSICLKRLQLITWDNLLLVTRVTLARIRTSSGSLSCLRHYVHQPVSRTSSSRQHGQGYALGCNFKVKSYHFRKAIDQTRVTTVSLGFQIQLGISNSAYVRLLADCDQKGPVIDKSSTVSEWSFRMEHTLLQRRATLRGQWVQWLSCLRT